MEVIPFVVFAILTASCVSQESELKKVAVEPKADKRFEVKISPESLKLDFSSNKEAKKLIFTIWNRSEETQVFNCFYECWQPILILESGEEIKLVGGADHFREPTAEDYPSISPGESQGAEVSINFFSGEKGGLSLKADSGTWFSTRFASQLPLSVGRFKLCIEYDSKESQWLNEKRTELDVAAIFEGKTRSNIIDIVVSE